jgi:hypothetical protein
VSGADDGLPTEASLDEQRRSSCVFGDSFRRFDDVTCTRHLVFESFWMCERGSVESGVFE